MVYVNNVAGESVDVLLQDATTNPFEYLLTRELNDVTILSTQDGDSNTVTLSPGHNVVVGNFIEIYVENGSLPYGLRKRFTQQYVVSVSTNVIRFSKHMGFPTSPSIIVSSKRTSANMNVSGTLDTPVVFGIGPPDGFKWDLTRTIGAMILTTNPDDALFGNITKLTNGIFFGREGNLFKGYLVDIRENAGFRGTAFDVNYTTRSTGGGAYGMSYRKSFSGTDKYGVVIRLEGLRNDRFVVYIQDDLTGIVEFQIKVMGHIVTDL